MRLPVLMLSIAAALSSAAAAAQQVDVTSGSVAQSVAGLRPGEFVWAPQIAPQGPMLLLVNLKKQRALLFRNGVPIAATTVSTGSPGRETPTGVFTILQKQVEHYSSKYDNAPMPFMQRLTWQGVALHAGKLPGYPASHGCIRLPAEFAKLLYEVTALGMTVVISDRESQPRVAPSPDLLAAPDVGAPQPAGAIVWTPDRAPAGPVSIIISAADKRVVVLRNGTEIGSAPIKIAGPVAGTWAYSLQSTDAQPRQWLRLSLGKDAPSNPVSAAEWRQFEVDPAFRQAVAGIVTPGTTIVVTPDSLRSTASPLTIIDAEPLDRAHP
ncbi:L,D-transpeptidase family protein [Sphingomonas flavescens]|uniref:L,D-transpeptidase family protein n=1 Tax=Sphingomonas flavescens TaxID=3132797 RepID=UPI0028041959|nr:L,D-transpeptidase family protein [Sphingomonas limnosediminicola]